MGIDSVVGVRAVGHSLIGHASEERARASSCTNPIRKSARLEGICASTILGYKGKLIARLPRQVTIGSNHSTGHTLEGGTCSTIGEHNSHLALYGRELGRD